MASTFLLSCFAGQVRKHLNWTGGPLAGWPTAKTFLYEKEPSRWTQRHCEYLCRWAHARHPYCTQQFDFSEWRTDEAFEVDATTVPLRKRRSVDKKEIVDEAHDSDALVLEAAEEPATKRGKKRREDPTGKPTAKRRKKSVETSRIPTTKPLLMKK